MNRSFDQSNKKIIDKQLLKGSDQLDKDILVELREQNCKDFFRTLLNSSTLKDLYLRIVNFNECHER